LLVIEYVGTAYAQRNHRPFAKLSDRSFADSPNHDRSSNFSIPEKEAMP
jgi:hypothetical protein